MKPEDFYHEVRGYVRLFLQECLAVITCWGQRISDNSFVTTICSMLAVEALCELATLLPGYWAVQENREESNGVEKTTKKDKRQVFKQNFDYIHISKSSLLFTCVNNQSYAGRLTMSLSVFNALASSGCHLNVQAT